MSCMSSTQVNPNKPHLVVAEWVYHARPGGDTHVVESRYERQLGSGEQFFERELVVGEEWAAITHCWLESAGMLTVGTGEGAADVVEVAFAGVDGEVPADQPRWLIHPGESFRGVPSSLTSLRLRCRRGEAIVTVGVVPA